MPDFNDLPKAVRETIYGMHLTYRKPINQAKHKKIVKYKSTYGPDRIKFFAPPLLAVSAEIEQEAAPFYYTSNVFIIEDIWPQLTTYTSPKHLKLVTRAIAVWGNTYATYTFNAVKRLKGLTELRIQVDELALLKKELGKGQSRKNKRSVPDDPSPQQQLVMLQAPGMAALTALPKIRLVEFVKKVQGKISYGGPIPGGVLETQIAPKLMGRKPVVPKKKKGKKSKFPFLSLSAELRNIIYELHLSIAGTVEPSTKEPTSALKRSTALSDANVPESVLSLLAVNRQIHDEAVGIFYHVNALVFPDTLHLHAFILALGSKRQECVRDLTIHYADYAPGGLSLTELAFSQLKRLTGLRTLKIILQGDIAKKIIGSSWNSNYHMRSANPASVRGMKELFELRGVTSIEVTDEVLDQRYQQAKDSTAYPDFPPRSRHACVVKVHSALQHFNAALAEAQKGNVQDEIFDDDELAHGR
ncbi:hypothetical protein LTR56_021143 [Elasticomyces elasticus]|nr:hypothetical protein LTR56_021143 [Elasticomyces elasticus]KAK3631818.1 hypothetical protein LTR22_020886 [Elasticomyces elasticus]KAK4909674.1 hypothetical protein LTR49_021568 [Elasticomyces elasticus]KAK5749536.1 hypothetical protein LTS12_020402 [Elasticomyces elasticus]